MNPLFLIALGGMLLLSAAAVAVRALRPSPPRISAVMAQLNAQPSRRVARPAVEPDRGSSWAPVAAIAFAERRLGAREQDLAILGHSHADLAITKIGWAVGGALFPALACTILTLGGVQLPFAVPLVASVGAAAFCWVNPSRQLAEDADRARAEFRGALAAYLSLVGLERMARGSVEEALEEASRGSGSRPFRLIHAEVLNAELNRQLPWAALKDLGHRIDVDELVTLADTVSVAADGAAVFDTLMAESRSMRKAENNSQLERAGRANEQLVAPNMALFVCFGALLILPAAVRIVGQG